jgi:hypothetical protein
MRIVGDWFLFPDGERRPLVRGKLQTGHGTPVTSTVELPGSAMDALEGERWHS